jgi:ADP-ribose pyrophosphatase YjhB (NUDIX family)
MDTKADFDRLPCKQCNSCCIMAKGRRADRGTDKYHPESAAHSGGTRDAPPDSPLLAHVVLDGQDRVFLVKHTYVSGWHLPGGGVEPGETVLDALARELKEEGNIELAATPTQFGIYFQPAVSQRDHVVLFVVTKFCQPAPPVPDNEIKAHGFFPRHALPPDTTRATRARIAEVTAGAPVSPQW